MRQHQEIIPETEILKNVHAILYLSTRSAIKLSATDKLLEITHIYARCVHAPLLPGQLRQPSLIQKADLNMAQI